MARTDPRPHYGTCRRVTAEGYVNIYEPSHPLARADGYVFEHRKMMWDAGLLTDPDLEEYKKQDLVQKNAVVAKQIWGPVPASEIRLISCGGAFIGPPLYYQDNLVGMGTLT